MKITFRDKFGAVVVEVDEQGISFLEGCAYFSDGNKDYKVFACDLLCVAQ